MAKARLPFKEFEWTSELAYAIGLLVTDGNLSKDGRHITMRSAEPELLETFKVCLNLKTTVRASYKNGYPNKPTYRVQFSSVQFYNWLLTIGLFPAKTYTIGALKIQDQYFADFLRGHLDGDGSILAYVDRYNHYRGRIYSNQRLFVKFISASKFHIAWLYQKICTLTNVKGAIICTKPSRPNRVPMWQIKFAKKESIRLLNWIYYREDVPCLERKRLIAKQVLEKISKERRRPYTFVKTKQLIF